MPQQKQSQTDGYYILKETDVKNQFHFFAKDGECLKNINERDILPLLALFLLEDEEGEKKTFRFLYEISHDRKVIRITVQENTEVNQDDESTVKARPYFLKKIDMLFKEVFG